MTGLLRPLDLQQISSDAEIEKMDEERRLKKKKDEQAKDLREAFLSREIQPEAIDRINNAITIAAKNGQHQIQVFTFPASYCNDGGRRINNLLPDWPDSLEGFAKKAYEFYQKELRPLGYKFHAEVINFPGGVPGEIGLFLRW
jgi:hypothetical protein